MELEELQINIEDDQPMQEAVTNRLEEKQNEVITAFLKELDRRGTTESDTPPLLTQTQAKDSKIQNRLYMQKIMPKLSDAEKEKTLGPDRQAVRYPVLKDVKKLWSYDFAKEEKKRFKGLPVWEPTPQLNAHQIDEYLQRVSVLWPKKTGMNEELALKLLMQNSYDISRTLNTLGTSNMASSFEIVQLINQMTESDAKIEFTGYLIKLSDI